MAAKESFTVLSGITLAVTGRSAGVEIRLVCALRPSINNVQKTAKMDI
ncbi:unknown [Tannerella sp. CAG:118]|nr:unknown [Tannerella sp. CAG:118]